MLQTSLPQLTLKMPLCPWLRIKGNPAWNRSELHIAICSILHTFIITHGLKEWLRATRDPKHGDPKLLSASPRTHRERREGRANARCSLITHSPWPQIGNRVLPARANQPWASRRCLAAHRWASLSNAVTNPRDWQPNKGRGNERRRGEPGSQEGWWPRPKVSGQSSFKRHNCRGVGFLEWVGVLTEL